jgi:hypothetical protein
MWFAAVQKLYLNVQRLKIGMLSDGFDNRSFVIG